MVMSMGPYSYLWCRMWSAYADVKISTVGKWKILLHTKINQTHSMPHTLSCNNNLLFEDTWCLLMTLCRLVYSYVTSTTLMMKTARSSKTRNRQPAPTLHYLTCNKKCVLIYLLKRDNK